MQQVLSTTQELVKILQQQTAMDTGALESLNASDVVAATQIVSRKLWKRRRAVAMRVWQCPPVCVRA